MSRWTDYAENKLADMMRGTAWSLGSSLFLGLASAASDSSITELSGTGYARQEMVRELATWAGTQAAGSISASIGTSHLTSNNAAVDFGDAGAAWGTANYVVLYDALTSGNALAYFPISSQVIGLGDNPFFDIAEISFTLGLSGGVSDYLANKLIDLIFRGQTYTWPANTYLALCTAAPTNSSGGTEVAGAGGYARQTLPSTTTFWSSTNGTGTTGASTGGTAGEISNNLAITFPTPSADWGTITHDKQMDASSGGNMLFYGTLDAPKTVLSGGSFSYGINRYKTQIA